MEIEESNKYVDPLTPIKKEEESNPSLEDLNQDITSIITAQTEINYNQLFEGVWNLAPYLGEQITSEYYLCLMILQMVEKSQFNEDAFTERLMKNQFKDGSWDQIRDQNNKFGNLDTTIFHYWYLKTIVDLPQNRGNMEKVRQVTYSIDKAKKWILSKGGIESAQLMTKYKLAIFGQYSWDDLPYIPVFLFKNEGIFKYVYAKNKTPQWVYPHLVTLTYLRYQMPAFVSYFVADLRDLWVKYPSEGIKINPRSYKSNAPNQEVEILVKEIFSMKKPQGSFGTYTICTVLSLICLRDFERKYPQFYISQIYKGFQDGFKFVEENYFNRSKTFGSVDDGRWWDTILISLAMLEGNGEKDSRICEAVEKMVREGLQINKGIGYGLDFEDTPDTDDTALLLILLNQFNDKYKPEIDQTITWLFSMQNSDGGFPAFNKDLTDNNWFQRKVYDFFGMYNSCEMFDPSCADITGHVMECLGSLGYSADHQVIIQMIRYLKSTQNEWGSWEARWGINHIYAVGSVIPGLARIHYDMNEAWVQKAIQYILDRQNNDGGFGESTLSFTDPQKWNGVGISTVTQTAWGLLVLIECYQINKQAKQAAAKAVSYLVKQFKIDENQFIDHSVVGVGHRKILYLQYPSYSQVFPMLSLARFRKVLNNSYQFSQNKFAGNGEMKLW